MKIKYKVWVSISISLAISWLTFLGYYFYLVLPSIRHLDRTQIPISEAVGISLLIFIGSFLICLTFFRKDSGEQGNSDIVNF